MLQNRTTFLKFSEKNRNRSPNEKDKLTEVKIMWLISLITSYVTWFLSTIDGHWDGNKRFALAQSWIYLTFSMQIMQIKEKQLRCSPNACQRQFYIAMNSIGKTQPSKHGTSEHLYQRLRRWSSNWTTSVHTSEVCRRPCELASLPEVMCASREPPFVWRTTQSHAAQTARRRLNAGPTSTTLDQHWADVLLYLLAERPCGRVDREKKHWVCPAT